ncbi:MAG: UDP-glucose/iron transport system ATP-binding protein [Halanaerobiales bacterium]|nr:UDP-glucose/iron transport system ATP-binding protein [Halanaerobiales bacterium]
MFQLENVRYKNILKIDQLTIKKGLITCILGKSGSGKTTLLKLLNNMLGPDSGLIIFKDRNICKYDPIELRREIVMLPQNPVVFSNTIRDNFILTEKYAENPHAGDSRYKEILSKVGIDKKLDDSADNLSGGEKQRLALARVLLLNPGILLLDEPSSALDEKTEEKIIEMVVNYIKEKKGTLVMVTHSKKIAEKYSDVIITIDRGRIIDLALKEG